MRVFSPSDIDRRRELLPRVKRVRKRLEEQIVQTFAYGCPYCDQPISYDQFTLKVGENEITCPSCKKKYIKVVSDSFEEKG